MSSNEGIDPELEPVIEAIEEALEEPTPERRFFVVIAVQKYLHPIEKDDFI